MSATLSLDDEKLRATHVENLRAAADNLFDLLENWVFTPQLPPFFSSAAAALSYVAIEGLESVFHQRLFLWTTEFF
jgi:hypothetical protein